MLERLQDTWVSQWISQSTWGYPIVGALHVLAIALFAGTVLITDSEVRIWRRIGVTLVLATGALLFVSEAMKCYGSAPFFVKMGLLAAALLFTFTFHRYLAKKDAPPSAVTKFAACLCITLWFGVGLAGRAIAFF